MIKLSYQSILATLFFSAGISSGMFSQEQPDSLKKKNDAQELSLKLSNPVAKLINIPFQFNITQGVGAFNGSQLVTNFQPVIPFTVGKVNIITRTIVPFLENRNVISSNSTEFGLSDINFSAFISPVKVGKLTWGIGPSFALPTASEKYFGTEKWAVGPTAVILKQFKGITTIVLVRQMWSFAGTETRADVNQFFINPGFGYAFKSGAGLGANVEYTTNWDVKNSEQLFLNFSGSMVSKFGKLPVSFSMGPRFGLTPDTQGDWGLRAGFTMIFAK